MKRLYDFLLWSYECVTKYEPKYFWFLQCDICSVYGFIIIKMCTTSEAKQNITKHLEDMCVRNFYLFIHGIYKLAGNSGTNLLAYFPSISILGFRFRSDYKRWAPSILFIVSGLQHAEGWWGFRSGVQQHDFGEHGKPAFDITIVI